MNKGSFLRDFDKECYKRRIAVYEPPNEGKGLPWHRLVVVNRVVMTVRVQSASSLALVRVSRVRPKKRRAVFETQGVMAPGVDFLAVFIVPMDRWHIFRAEECRKRRIRIRVNPGTSGVCAASLERWDYFLPKVEEKKEEVVAPV